MPERYWHGPLAFVALGLVLLIFALGLTWDFSALLTEERVSEENRSKAHIEYAQDRINENCRALEGMAFRNCVQEEIEASKDHSRAEGDLDAQQAMALFTRWMAYTGVAGVVLAGASVVLILATLWETRSGIEIMRNEQRPWLKLTTEAHCKFTITVGEHPGVDFQSAIVNVGSTVATQVRLKTRLSVQTVDGDVIHDGNWVLHGGRYDSVLFPNDPAPGPSGVFCHNFDLREKLPLEFIVLIRAEYRSPSVKNTEPDFFTEIARCVRTATGGAFFYSDDFANAEDMGDAIAVRAYLAIDDDRQAKIT